MNYYVSKRGILKGIKMRNFFYKTDQNLLASKGFFRLF